MWVEWLLFSLIVIVTLLIFRSKLYTKIRGDTPDRGEGVLGEIGSILILNVVDMDEYTQIADRLFHADGNVAAFTTHMVMSKLQ